LEIEMLALTKRHGGDKLKVLGLSLFVGIVLSASVSTATLANRYQASQDRLDVSGTTGRESESASGAVVIDDVGAMSHAARMALFARRVAEFRLLHRAPILRARVSRVAYRPILPGKTDRECLTQAVYYEARGEPAQGQVAVAQVVLNRSRAGGRYPASLCGVVFQGASRPGCQFSFACEGGRQGGPIDAAAWTRAGRIADSVMTGQAMGDPRATHYHTAAVAPAWDRTIAKLAQIGHHIFFGGSEPQPTSMQASAEPINRPQT
jgi:hypothetical protein